MSTENFDFYRSDEFYKILISHEDIPIGKPEEVKFIEALTNIYMTSVFCSQKFKFIYIKLGFKYEISKFLSKFLDLNYKNLSFELETNSNKDILMKNFQITLCLVGLTRHFTNYSATFCKQFYKSNGIEILFKYLKNQHLINKYILSKRNNEEVETKLDPKIIRGLIGCLVNLSKFVDNFKHQWKEQNSIDFILNLSEQLKDYDDCQLACYIILASIADDDEVKKFPNIKIVLPELIKIISYMTKNMLYKKQVQRISIQLGENDKNLSEIIKADVRGTSWNLVELLMALYHMAVNDEIKKAIFYENEMNEHLKIIILKGNEIEIEYGLKILWQLCFDLEISSDVLLDKELYEKIQSFLTSHKDNKKLVKNADGILWLIEQKKGNLKTNNQKKLSNHVMISYNRENRDLCLKIKKELELEAHSVWIDVEDIHGSSLESMANAIENSKCVLMCMTEKYKQSTFCRAEAEYAFQLGKPIIPLIMQKDYKPDGWLGIILGSKIFVNFTKYDFEECIKRTLNEIKNFDLNLNIPTLPTRKCFPLYSQPDLNNITQVEKWTEEQVDKWIKEKNFHSVIIKNVSPCNGRILNQLFQMHKQAPEFFYSSISSNNPIPTKDIAYFILELSDLFKI